MKPVKLSLTLPGSKSLSQRALICAALARGKSVLRNVNYCEDVNYLMNVLSQLGVRFVKKSNSLWVYGVAGKFIKPNRPVFVGDSGANWRFLSELVPAGTKLTGSTQLQRRLKLPNATSQTISGQLLAKKISQPPAKLVSAGYVALTLQVLKKFSGKGRDYIIEPDASAAMYWLTYNFITGSKITFTNWPAQSLQPDYGYSKLLKQLAHGKNVFDLGNMPDSVMSLAVAAMFTNRKIIITNIAHLAGKETNRLLALHENLQNIGVKNNVTKNSLTIWGTVGKFKRAKIKTFHDHRIAMAFGILGLPVDDRICVKKSYPNFWNDYKQLQQANVMITGMRGVGKTTTGKKLAKQWGMKFVDVDQRIEQRAKLPVTQIVERYGWKKFRELEHEICTQITKLQNTVISTGGGTLMYQRNYQLLKPNYCILLTAPLNVIKQRLQQSYPRPELGTIEMLWQKRKARYYAIADSTHPFPLSRGKGQGDRGLTVITLTHSKDIHLANQTDCDAIELRTDFFSPQTIASLTQLSQKPVITNQLNAYHNFKRTPSFAMLDKLVQHGVTKIATMINVIEDNWVIAQLLQKYPHKITAIGMGELGIMTRLHPWNQYQYVVLDGRKPVAPGQLTLSQRDVKLYGIIGQPVQHSLSPKIHNAWFNQYKINALYQRWETHDLKTMINLMRFYKLSGASVTAPYKQTVMQYLDKIDPVAQKIGAVNTIIRRGNKLVGYNTDWIGVKSPLGDLGAWKHGMKGKHILILGQGGVARAVQYAAQQSGAQSVKMISARNRITETNFDVLVNATPIRNRIFISKKYLRNKIIIDCNYGKSTKLVASCHGMLNTTVIDGLPMLQAQAAAQFKLWTGKMLI